MCEMMDISVNKSKEQLRFYLKPGSITNVKRKHSDNDNTDNTSTKKQFIIKKNIVFDNEATLENNIITNLENSNQKMLRKDLPVYNDLSKTQQLKICNKTTNIRSSKTLGHKESFNVTIKNNICDKDNKLPFCIQPEDSVLEMDQIFVVKNANGHSLNSVSSSEPPKNMLQRKNNIITVKNISSDIFSESTTISQFSKPNSTTTGQAGNKTNIEGKKVLIRRSLLKTRPNILRESKIMQGVSILKKHLAPTPEKTDNEVNNSAVDKLNKACSFENLNNVQSKYNVLLNTKLNKVHNPIKVNKVLKKSSSKIVLDSYHYDPTLPPEPIEIKSEPVKPVVSEPEEEFYPDLQLPVGLFVNRNFIAKEADKANTKSMAVVSISTDKSNNTTQIVINTSQGQQIFQGKTSDLLEATSHGTEEWARSLDPPLMNGETEEDVDGDLEEGESKNSVDSQIVKTEQNETPISEEEDDPEPKNTEDVPGVDESPVMDALENIGITSDQLFSIITGNGSRLWICAERGCGQLFSRLASLKIHILEHYKIKPFRCSFDDCEWAFYSSFKLKRHKETHTKTKEYTCTEPGCDRRLTTVSNLRQHLKLHRRPASFSCCVDDCTMIFQTKRSYEMHLKTHKGVEAPYKCPVETCGKAYFSFSSLNSHSRSHQHKEEEIKCSWEGCGKIFDQPCRLKAHMRQHTGDKPYKCYFPNCNWCFTSSSKLRRHQKKHSKERKFSCTVEGCGKAFMRSEHLREHIMTHFGNRSFPCPFENCNTVFPAKSTLYKHVLHVHKNNKRKNKPNILTKCRTVKNSENISKLEHKINNKNHETVTNSPQKYSLSKEHVIRLGYEMLSNSEYSAEALYACGVEYCSIVCTGKDLTEHMLRNHTAFVSSDDGTQYGCVSLVSDQTTELASEVSISTEELSNEPYLINLSEYSVDDGPLELGTSMFSSNKYAMIPKDNYSVANAENSEEINIVSNEDHTTQETSKTDEFAFKYLIDTQNIQVKNLLNNPEMEIRAVFQNKFCNDVDNEKMTLNYDVIVPGDSYIDFVGSDNERSNNEPNLPDESAMQVEDNTASGDGTFDNVLVDSNTYVLFNEGESKTVQNIVNEDVDVKMEPEVVQDEVMLDRTRLVTNKINLNCARTFLTYQRFRQLREKVKQNEMKQKDSSIVDASIQGINPPDEQNVYSSYASQNIYEISSLKNGHDVLKMNCIANAKPNININNLSVNVMLNTNSSIQTDTKNKCDTDVSNHLRTHNNVKKISHNAMEQSETSPLQITSNPMMTYGMIDPLGEKILEQPTNENLGEEMLSVNTENISINSLLMTNDLSGSGLYDQDDVSQFPVLLMDPSGTHEIDYPENTINLRDFE